MFENIKAATPASKSKASRNKKEIPQTSAFVRALKDNNTRISYTALAIASEALGEHTPSGLSAGQRGSGICKNLPVDLQPFVCRAGGGYSKDASWPEEANAPSVDALKALDRVKKDAVLTYVEAFQKATAPENSTEESPDSSPSEDEPSEEPSDDEIES